MNSKALNLLLIFNFILVGCSFGGFKPAPPYFIWHYPNSSHYFGSDEGAIQYFKMRTTEREKGDSQLIQEQGGLISTGGNSAIIAQTGNIRLKGTAVVAEGKNQLLAEQGNIELATATTTDQSAQSRKGHGIGEAVISDTERFFGYNRTRFNQDGESIIHQGNQIASLKDSIEINAGKDYKQTASELLAKENIKIEAKNIQISNALNKTQSEQSESDLKIGNFSRIKSPILDLLMSLESAVKNDKASDRLKAANAASLVAQGYTLYDTASKVLSKPQTQAYLFRAESGFGVAHSRQSQEINGIQSQGNLLNAKHINLNATEGSLSATHTTFRTNDQEGNRQGGSSIQLNAKENIQLNAGESHYKQKGRSQNAGIEVGTAITVGAQTGWSFYGKVGFGNQKQDGEQTLYHNTKLDSDSIHITSGKDTALIGTTANAKEIQVNAEGDLKIESQQDRQTQSQKGMNVGLQVEFGFGNSWNISGSASGERGKSNFKQVNEQSGLFAEEGGYHIEANNVHLKGAAIASTNAENSELTTNKLTFEDIQNESSHSAMSGSISGGYGKGADYNVDKETGKIVSKEYAKANQSTTEEVKPNAAPNFGGGLPMFSQGSDNSSTKATLTEGKITLNKDSTRVLSYL